MGPVEDTDEYFYYYDEGALEEGEEPWVKFEGYGAFEGSVFVMDGLVEFD